MPSVHPSGSLLVPLSLGLSWLWMTFRGLSSFNRWPLVAKETDGWYWDFTIKNEQMFTWVLELVWWPGWITNSGEVIHKDINKKFDKLMLTLLLGKTNDVITSAAAEIKTCDEVQTWRRDNEGRTKNKKNMYIFVLLHSAFFLFSLLFFSILPHLSICPSDFPFSSNF